MLMRLMSKGEYLIVPKGTKFTGAGKLGLDEISYKTINHTIRILLQFACFECFLFYIQNNI